MSSSNVAKQPVETLTRDNHEIWFYSMELWLRTKKAFDAVLPPTETMTPATTPISSSTAMGTTTIERNDESNVMALYWISMCIGDLDKIWVKRDTLAATVWSKLYKKYATKTPAACREYLRKVVTWKMDETKSIDQEWSNLQTMAAELAERMPEMEPIVTEEWVFKQLLTGLPEPYHAIRDGIDARRTVDVGQDLQTLREKELQLSNKTEETAMIARNQNSKKKSPRQQKKAKFRRSRSKSLTSSSESESQDECWFCGADGHRQRDCKRYQRAQREARKALKKSQKGKGSTRTHKRKAFKAEGPQTENETTDDDASSQGEMNEETAHLSHQVVNSSDADNCKTSRPVWIADTAATSHMTDERRNLRRLEGHKGYVKVGGGRVAIRGRGDAAVRGRGVRALQLQKVLFVPSLGVNLLAMQKLCTSGNQGRFNQKRLWIENSDGHPVITATYKKGLYVIDPPKGTEHAYPTIEDNETEVSETSTIPDSTRATQSRDDKKYELWHRRLSHFSPSILRNLHERTSCTKIPISKQICAICHLANMRNRRNHSLSERKDQKLDLVSIDIAGPFPMSINGYRYFLQIVDNYTRYVWTINLKAKSDAKLELDRWRHRVEDQSQLRLRAVRSDNAAELNETVQNWCNLQNVEYEPTAPYSSHQNGVAEISIQITEARIRAMIKDAHLPIVFWSEATAHQALIRNLTGFGPNEKRETTTPYEAWTGERANPDELYIWGSRCYSHVPHKSLSKDDRHDKLIDHGRMGVFLGYSSKTKAQVRIYAPDLGYVIRVPTSNVKVDESIPGGRMDLKIRTSTNVRRLPTLPLTPIPALSKESRTQESNPISTLVDRRPRGRPRKEDSKTQQGPHVESLPASGPLLPEKDQDPTYQPESPDETQPSRTQPKRGVKRDRSMSPPPIQEVTMDDPDTEWVPQDYVPKHRVEVVIPQPVQRLESGEAEGKRVRAYIADTDRTPHDPTRIKVPQSYQQAMSSQYKDEWMKAMVREVKEVMANNTFTVVTRPRDCSEVSMRWVYSLKYKPNGEIERFKARLVARGFSQIHGVNYTETFAPTIRIDSLRVFLAIVAIEDLECDVVDVCNAFTEADLKEKVYLTPPPMIEVRPGQVLRCNRSLYGLKQAARDWNQTQHKKMIKMGFTQSKADPCIYYHPERHIMIGVYVDDMPIAAKSRKEINWFKEAFAKRFKIKDLGEITEILGIRITRNRAQRWIELDQEQYIMKIMRTHGMEEARRRPVATPMGDGAALREREDDEAAVIGDYQQLIGSVLYGSTQTRPDIAMAVNKLSQYLANPASFHQIALKKVLRYLRSTSTYRIRYGGKGTQKFIEGYTDADYAGDINTRRSTLGYIFTFAGGAISWKSTKQRSVATSTTEAEYMAMAAGTKQAIWLQKLLQDLDREHYIRPKGNPIRMFADNTSAQRLAENPEINERSKHIDVAYHFIRECVRYKQIKFIDIPSEEMLADGLTKPLGKTAFNRFIDGLQIQGSKR
jgi:hypothetical protein